jgi:hypothetical protein
MSYADTFLKFGYTPTYNILDYLEKIDSVLFNSNKEYFAMLFYAIPVGDLTPTTAYIDVTGIQYGGGTRVLGTVHSTTGNKVYFGTDLKLEWESIFINTL